MAESILDLFPAKELGTYFIIYNYFIIRLIFCKIEVPATLTFKCFPFIAMKAGARANYLCHLFSTILFSRRQHLLSHYKRPNPKYFHVLCNDHILSPTLPKNTRISIIQGTTEDY